MFGKFYEIPSPEIVLKYISKPKFAGKQEPPVLYRTTGTSYLQ